LPPALIEVSPCPASQQSYKSRDNMSASPFGMGQQYTKISLVCLAAIRGWQKIDLCLEFG
jgi:uncharacterized protein (DUF488 family)